ncbi:class A beta-lactamase-related serine hydrolase [Alginatibacterium sediminis]|uniref:Class A beta-lactamase-related serine hydrolase n=1 Tax=Alginatibacterium sediminis TaxID=2164068 RepID=A0A420EB44_9ALTE|nr:serine hydrolase domain-containing protein [Alginatibacterium sediminis]RKF17901.1 class A beta-lactamase-related serine hydrolase [Alginatibacterium sediminis]
MSAPRKNKLLILGSALAVSSVMGNAASTPNTTQDILKQYMAVPGANVTLPVSAVKDGFSHEFAEAAHNEFNNFHYQMGGDHALYYNSRLSEMLGTAVAYPASNNRQLEINLDPRIGQVRFDTTNSGNIALDDYVLHPNHRVQGVMMIHKGEIVYQAFPGMNPSDKHVWMSAAKATVGLVIAQLVEEGKVDLDTSISNYVPELKGSNWDDVSVKNALNMATGLQLEETLESILDPESIIVRFFSAEFGQAAPGSDKIENWLDVVKQAQKIDGEQPGEVNRYSSATTTVLNYMAELIENKPWTDIFEQRVWGKLGADKGIEFNLTPEGTAVAHGLVSTTLEDMAKFGTLFTPSWDKVADEEIVSASIMNIIYDSANPDKVFKKGGKYQGLVGDFIDAPKTNSFQFDAVFADGALYKHGNLGQGIYIDPQRDFVGVYFSTNPYIAPYGEDKMAGFMREAAKLVTQ